MKALVETATGILQEASSRVPVLGLILGSGLGDFAQQVRDSVTTRYQDISGYPQPTVKGHAGEFIQGFVGEVPVILARGRFHWYEGHSLDTIALPIQIFSALGASRIIVTNAAGSVRTDVPPGTLMLIDRYLDATFLEKPVPVYYEGAPWIDESWLRSAEELARSMGIPITSGTYCWTSGPSYETPAEIDYFRTKGADAVGMSTLPEVRVAARLGLPALAISALTNFAAGITQEPLTHHEVIETAAQLKPRFEAWMKALIQQAPSLNF